MFAVLFAATLMFVWTGCSKKGPPGEKGNPGNANVIASDWLLFRNTRPDMGGSVASDLSDNMPSILWKSYALPVVMAPVLTDEAGCIICVYFRYGVGDDEAHLLPVYFTPAIFGQRAIMTASVNIDATIDPNPYIFFSIYSLSGNNLNTNNFKQNYLDMFKYRVIVVPQAATKSRDNKSLKAELEKMSYLELCGRYNIVP